jgi:hypothetical protein
MLVNTRLVHRNINNYSTNFIKVSRVLWFYMSCTLFRYVVYSGFLCRVLWFSMSCTLFPYVVYSGSYTNKSNIYDIAETLMKLVL